LLTPLGAVGKRLPRRFGAQRTLAHMRERRLFRVGVRLVCMSHEGAELIRRKLKRYLIDGNVTRERHRPATPTW
jgi:hypothetical protein